MEKTIELEEKTLRLLMQKVRAARLALHDGDERKAVGNLKEVELFLLLRLSEKRKDADS